MEKQMNIKRKPKLFSILVIVFLTALSFETGCVSWSTKDIQAEKKESMLGKVFKSIDGEPVVPREANRIIVTDFWDNTHNPDICEKLSLRIRELINIDGRLAVVSSENDADLRLNGKVILYQIQPLKYNLMGLQIKKRMKIVAVVSLRDNLRKKDIFYDMPVQAFEEYSEIDPPITSEESMRLIVIENLSKRIALQTVTGWYTQLMTPEEKGRK
jgi:hypothetical protein